MTPHSLAADLVRGGLRALPWYAWGTRRKLRREISRLEALSAAYVAGFHYAHDQQGPELRTEVEKWMQRLHDEPELWTVDFALESLWPSGSSGARSNDDRST